MPLVRVSAFGLSPEAKKQIAAQMHGVIMENTEARCIVSRLEFTSLTRNEFIDLKPLRFCG